MDVLGCLLSVVVHAANIHDTKGGIFAAKRGYERYPWEILPWRWVVERTFSWLNHSRRLSKDYEISVSSAEAMVKISHFHTLLKRL